MASVTYTGTGRRKTSVARVILTPGVGRVVVNGKELDDYFGRRVLQTIAVMPFEATHTQAKFDVRVNVVGGGMAGQAGAIRHGIARALIVADENLRTPLKRAGFLTRDARVKSSARRPASRRPASARSSPSASPRPLRHRARAAGVPSRSRRPRRRASDTVASAGVPTRAAAGARPFAARPGPA